VYSSDGIKWSAVNNTRIRIDIRDIIYAENKFIAGGNQGKMATSTDGITWKAVSENILGKASNGLGYDVRTIAYGNGMFVAGGEDGRIAYSTGNK
jgi:hypothetical protein